VRVNGERVAEGKLKPGDELQIGIFKYQLCGDPLGRSRDHPPVDAYQAVPPSPASDAGDVSESDEEGE
jgi:hypothetical protein